MSELNKAQRRMIRVAQRHGNVYHLPRRYRIPAFWDIKDERDLDYDAAEDLVARRIARWGGGRGPKIELEPRYQIHRGRV